MHCLICLWICRKSNRDEWSERKQSLKNLNGSTKSINNVTFQVAFNTRDDKTRLYCTVTVCTWLYRRVPAILIKYGESIFQKQASSSSKNLRFYLMQRTVLRSSHQEGIWKAISLSIVQMALTFSDRIRSSQTIDSRRRFTRRRPNRAIEYFVDNIRFE